MPDHLTPEQRSRAMKAVKLRNGALELLVQRELRRKGLRFQRNCKSLHGSPDIVFRREKLVIFIDGDFWHGWRLPSWEHKLSEFWRTKLHTNRKRDQRNFRCLRREGWTVVRLWGHQIQEDLSRCVARICQEL